MSRTGEFPANGGCTCGAVRYRLTQPPLFVHCCHCSWCQRETGSAFALNAMIESSCVELTKGSPEEVATPTKSGGGQTFMRCPSCRIALWSYYAGAGRKVSFVRVGTLDKPVVAPPDIHIFTMSKQPWVVIPDGIPAFEGYYDWKKQWPEKAQQRRAAMKK